MATHIQTTFFSSVLSATEMINHLSTNYENDISFHAKNESVLFLVVWRCPPQFCFAFLHWISSDDFWEKHTYSERSNFKLYKAW